MKKQEIGENLKRIVIVGTGFAGMYAYMELHKILHDRKDVFITLLNKNDYFLFVPMIHEVAVGNLRPGSITQSLRVLPQCCLDDFIEGEVFATDLDGQKITYKNTHITDSHDNHIKGGVISYDYLILAPGSTTNFFGVPGAREYSITLKDINDAKKIKNHILHRFEEAQSLESEGEKRRILKFVIVGGGPTGVELAGEIADIFNKELKDIYPDLYPLSSVVIIQSGSQLISSRDVWFANKTQEILEKKKKVKILLNTRVTKVNQNSVEFGDGEKINAGTIIWTAGIKAHNLELSAIKGVDYESRSNRVKTNRLLQIPNYKNVYAVGDYAWVPLKDGNGAYPTRAQFATHQGKIAAKNISTEIFKDNKFKEFDHKDQGFIVSLGKNGALANVFGINFSGFIAWWVYRTAYLFRIVGTRAKLRTALEWTLNLFLPRDLTEL